MREHRTSWPTAAALAEWPEAERSARVRVGDTVFEMDRAAFEPVHGG